MSPPAANAPPKDACPHCGKRVGLGWWDLLPSRDNKKFFVCKSCGGHYVFANSCKMASVAGGMVGMMLGMYFPFQWIAKAGNASKFSIIEGVLAAALTLGLASVTAARLALQLEPRR
jgi:hypothetical protein